MKNVVLPLFILCLFAVTLEAQKAIAVKATYSNPIEEETLIPGMNCLPKFVGGQQALEKYISDNLRYPQDAVRYGAEGIVFVLVRILADGSIGKAEVTRGFMKSCDAEALRLVKEMHDWNPALQSGRAVPTTIVIPIQFWLQ